MKKTLELAWGVIRRPAPTFRRIKEEKPLKEGLLMMLLLGITYLGLILVAFKDWKMVLKLFFSPNLSNLILVLGPFAMVVLFIYLVIVSYTVLINFVVRVLKGRNECKSLLISNFFIFGIIWGISCLLQSISTLTKQPLLFNFGKIPLLIWLIFLLILAIKRIYDFSLKKSIISLILIASAYLFLFTITQPTFYSASLLTCIIILSVLFIGITILVFQQILKRDLLKRKILYTLSVSTALVVIIIVALFKNSIEKPLEFMRDYCIYPQSIAIDDQSNIYAVSVFQSGKIFKFNSSGRFLDKFEKDIGYQIIIDYEGMIYLAAPQLRKGSWHFQKFNEEGELISSISLKMKEPTDRDYRNRLKDIGIDGQGNIYILARLRKNEESEFKVQKFNPEGKLLMEFGKKGKGDREFHVPWAMTVDREGNIYVTGLYKIQKFNNAGKFIKVFKSPKEKDSAYLGQLPMDIKIDREGNIYVLVMDWEIEEKRKIRVSKVKKFDSQGNLLMSVGGREREEEDFWLPDEIAIDKRSHIYVADLYNYRIQVFNSHGKFLRSIKHNPAVIKWFEESITGKFFDRISRPRRVVELKK